MVSWSSGKDSAWMLHQLQQDESVELIGLLTTLNQEFGRVAMHGVRRRLLELQAEAAGLPLHVVNLPWPCSNADYENIMAAEIQSLKDEHQLTHFAFGDLFLKEIKAYREKQFANSGLSLLFPLWGLDTAKLANKMIDAGQASIITCVDTSKLDASFSGRKFNEEYLLDIKAIQKEEAAASSTVSSLTIDPCGENGEFHSFTYASPAFSKTIDVELGEQVIREGFAFTDLIPV